MSRADLLSDGEVLPCMRGTIWEGVMRYNGGKKVNHGAEDMERRNLRSRCDSLDKQRQRSENKKGTTMKTVSTTLLMLCAITFSIALNSCATTETVTGRPIDQTTVAKIVDGETTEDQIITWFGAPTTTSQLGDNELYIYKYCVTSGSGFSVGYYTSGKAQENCDELTITFDKTTGKVKVHNFDKRVK